MATKPGRFTAEWISAFSFIFVILLFLSGCATYDKSGPSWNDFSKLERYTSDNQLQLHFSVLGKGKPVILIHGFAANQYTWRHLAPELSETHKVYLVDLKGFGLSPKPNDESYSLYDQAELIINFIEREKLKDVTLVGHSYGGGVALVTSLFLLENKPGTLEKLLLIDNIAYSQPTPFFLNILATPFLGGLVSSIIPAKFQVKDVLKKAYFNDDLITDEMVVAYAGPLGTSGAKNALLTTARQMFPSDLEDLSKRYVSINIPTKIIWGENDEIVPLKVGEKLYRVIPGASMDIINNCGHIPQEECPELTNRIIHQFISQ